MQKIVSYEVAKALKEAGYPQEYDVFGGTTCHYKNENTIQHHSMIGLYEDIECAAPTYLDVWLWLWREKKIRIETGDMGIYKIYDATEWVDNYGYHLIDLSNNVLNDPEEAIVKAIDYLVENNLIK